MTAPIGFYVHHHGRGHVSRAAAIVAELDRPATVLSSADLGSEDVAGAEVLHLPSDVPGPDHANLPDAPVPTALHHAPVGVPTARDRTATITSWLAEARPSLLVVDVSVEVAVLARLASTPVVYVRQNGERWDDAHRLGYGSAVSLLAPFPEELEEADVPSWVRDRTTYVGGFSRFDGRARWTAPDPKELGSSHARTVAVLAGAGGTDLTLDRVRAAADATADTRWVLVGGQDAFDDGQVRATGWVDDPLPTLLAADVVVGSAGHNSVMEVAAARRPFVCVPEDRPFDEQHRKGRRLAALDAAEVLAEGWPRAGSWDVILDRATARGAHRLAELVDGGGARRAAEHLVGLAEAWA